MKVDQNNLIPFTNQACQLVVSQTLLCARILFLAIVRIEQESIVLEQAALVAEASRFLPHSTASTSLPLSSLVSVDEDNCATRFPLN